jgi:pyrimidine-nucleoside phosphorylase
MDIPLGSLIGNSLEVIEAVETLNGRGPEDLTEVCLQLATGMLYLAGKGGMEACRAMAEKTIEDGSALKRLIAMVEAQGGDSSVIKDTSLFRKALFHKEVKAEKSGYITHMNTEQCGIASSLLGAGRITKESVIDYTAGIALKKKVGEQVYEGDVIAVLYTSEKELFEASEKEIIGAVTISPDKPKEEPLIYARVTKNGVERLI